MNLVAICLFLRVAFGFVVCLDVAAAEQHWNRGLLLLILLPWLLKSSWFYSSVIITAAYIVVYQCSHSSIQRLNSLPNCRFGYMHFLSVNWNSGSGCKDCKFIQQVRIVIRLTINVTFFFSLNAKNVHERYSLFSFAPATTIIYWWSEKLRYEDLYLYLSLNRSEKSDKRLQWKRRRKRGNEWKKALKKIYRSWQ